MNEYRNRRRLAVAALVFGMWTLGPRVVEAAAPGEACALLTQAQVSAALGVEVDPGRRPVASDPRMCNWREQGKPDGPARNVLVTLIGAKNFKAGKTPEPGLGDEAYFLKSGRFPFRLIVRKGAAYVQIMARSKATSLTDRMTVSDDSDKAVDKAIALEILKKL
jgi:hypothetical protein